MKVEENGVYKYYNLNLEAKVVNEKEEDSSETVDEKWRMVTMFKDAIYYTDK